MLQRPENKRCADCRKKDPRWVSWNLGLFMCIRCSGVHRSLGTHISKVKSVDLDSWTPEQIANVVRWGNATANKYWEANLSVEPTEATIGQWIRAKYDRKQFAMSGPMPEPETLAAGGGVGTTSRASTQQATQPAPAQSSPDMFSHISNQNNKPQSQPMGAEFFAINKPPGSSSSSQFDGFQAQTQAQAQASLSFFQNPPLSSPGQTQQPPQQAPQQQAPQHNLKMDIMSLYSTPAPSSPHRAQFAGGNPSQPQQSFQGMNTNMYGGSINQHHNPQPQQSLPQGGQYFSNFPSYPPPSQPHSQYGAYATGNPSYGSGMSGMMMNSSTPANPNINARLGMPPSLGAGSTGTGGVNLPSQLQSNPWANFGNSQVVSPNSGGLNSGGGAPVPKTYDPFGN